MVASQNSGLTSVQRDAWVEIDLSALEHNMKVVSGWLKPQTRLMAVVKSDAYGHGAADTAPVMAGSGASWFGVASVDEGLALRNAAIKQPILILSPCPFWAISSALKNNLQLTVTSLTQIEDIAKVAAQQACEASIHLKVDTGMHRLGIKPDQLAAVLSSIYDRRQLKLAGLLSHLAAAGDESATVVQDNCFQKVLQEVKRIGPLPELVHLASGEAARHFPFSHYDMVRVGLYLYGLEPNTVSDVVSPLMSVKGRINHVQEIEAGQAAGYGYTWTADERTRLASIPIGYADGIDRGLSNRIEGLLMGVRIKQIGQISMDQMLFDIGPVPQAQEGDVITLIGQEGGSQSKTERANRLYLASWATMLDTITYELACRLKVRLPRIYTRSRKTSI